MSLSKNYVITASFPVKYVNLPEDKIIANHLPETIDLELKSTGFNLLMYKIKAQKETILLDIQDARRLPAKNHFYIPCNEHLNKITSQFNSAIEIIKMKPDTVFINYNKKQSKEVPVKVNLFVDFDEQYQQTDSVIVDPEYITVSGPADALDSISYVETVPASAKKISAPLALKLEIKKFTDDKQIELSHNAVEVKMNVTKFTEAVMELPVEVENLPRGYNLKTFPDKVSVKYQVAFDNYGKINALDFRAIVDYNKIEPGSNKLKVQLVKVPPQVRSVKLNTDKVEYIIRK
ncbi:MAG TPA: CdaR family protein [Bacteroidia bacterium]|jgi:YbbR domain-containing protein